MKSFILLTFLALSAIARAQDIAFIAHPSLKEGSVTTEDVKNILLNNKTKWASGPAIKVAVLTDGPVHEKVMKDFVGRSPEQFMVYWKKQVFTGVGSMPAQSKTDAEVIAYVAENPGAFGYIAKSSVTDKVKVLTH